MKKEPVMYFGREVKALLPRGNPGIVMIDVLQKEGDCPSGYNREQRFKCINDCQDTFVSCIYSVAMRGIVGMGVLSRDSSTFCMDTIEKHGLSVAEAERLVKEEGEGIKRETFPARTNIYYNGDLLMFSTKCSFEVGDELLGGHPETKQYLDLITQDPEKIMKECGIEFHQDGNLEFIVYESKENRSDLAKSISDEPLPDPD